VTVSLNPSSVVGGSAAQGTVTLSAPASGAATISLSSSSPAATVPGNVSVAGGGTSATFSVATSQVQTPTTVTITATHSGGGTGTVALSVQQIPICGPFLTAQVSMPFVVYADDNDPRNHFIPSGFFGDFADLTLNTADGSSPQSGPTAIRIDYRPRGPQKFAGIFFQCGTFGDTQNVGFNLSLARQVQFWARASRANLKVEFKVGGIMGAFPDSFPSTATSPVFVELGTDWRQFTIDVSGRNLTRVIGGFMFVTSTAENPSGASVFIDEVVWR
jgi:hypothetical protein